MSQEKVREILSHVDISKIDLSSFKLSSKKFNELAHLYRNRVVVSCFSLIVHKNEHTADEVDTAFKMLSKVVANPNLYDYDTIYAAERKAVDDAIDDITTRRDRNINDIKIKAIENRMKDAYKQMRKTIEMALEHGNDFEDEFNEELVEKCMRIARESIENGRKKAVESRVDPKVVDEPKLERAECENEEKCKEEISLTETDKQSDSATNPKIGFWKRIFNKAKA